MASNAGIVFRRYPGEQAEAVPEPLGPVAREMRAPAVESSAILVRRIGTTVPLERVAVLTREAHPCVNTSCAFCTDARAAT